MASPSWANPTAPWPLDAAQPGFPNSRAVLAPHRASDFLAPGFLLFFRGVVLRPQEGHSSEQPGAPGGDKHFVEQPARALCACVPPWLKGVGLAFTELVCTAKEMLQ